MSCPLFFYPRIKQLFVTARKAERGRSTDREGRGSAKVSDKPWSGGGSPDPNMILPEKSARTARQGQGIGVVLGKSKTPTL